MKNVFLAIIAVLAFLMIPNTADAQKRTKISNGLYLVSYGNTYVIEDDNSQQSKPFVTITVERRKNSFGQEVYDVLCANKYTKDIAKTALKKALNTAIVSAASKIGAAAAGGATGGAAAIAGAASGAAIGQRISSYATSIASNIYDDVCNYYRD